MTDDTATLMAIIFGIAVFAVIVVIGWRSVQNRRIVRLQDADGHETIIVADEGDEISSVVTTTETTQSPAETTPSAVAVNPDATAPTPATEFGTKRETPV